MWPAAGIGCTILAGLSAGYGASQIAAAGDSIPWSSLILGQAVDWYSYLLFVPAIAWLTVRSPVAGTRWPLLLAAHVAADLLLALLKMTLFFAVGELSGAAGLPFAQVLTVDLDVQFAMIAGLTCLAHLTRIRSLKAPPARQDLPEYFSVRDSTGFRLIRPAEIIWADAQGNYARLHTAEGRHLIRSTMAALERSLESRNFVRIHRRFIVNAERIDRVDRIGSGTYRLHLADGSELRSARSYCDRISRLLG